MPARSENSCSLVPGIAVTAHRADAVCRRRSHTMASTTADTGSIYGSTLGSRVRELRRERGLTQEQLAGDRCTKEYVSQIERGVARPTQATIHWLAARLEADAEYLAT